jgi:pimeloyl-ACP methyl ester carboxylesterase
MRPILLVSLLTVFLVSEAGAQSPPSQPASGPGGFDYPHASVTENGSYWAGNRILKGEGRYLIYEPAGPVPATAPVVLFLHGWLATKPQPYMGWIHHMVRKGYTVVWVQYQVLATLPGSMADNAMAAWKDALNVLAKRHGHVRPARDFRGQMETAIVGHSVGGYLSAILAARAANPLNGIPIPRAVVAVEPGRVDIIPGGDLGAISPATKMVVVVGDEDDIVCKATGVAIWEQTGQIPDENRDFLLVVSDRHGAPEQVANHYFPNTTGFRDTAAVDARDFYVTYKLSVAALNCAFSGGDCSYALGDGVAEQLDMGEWSDSTPVSPMVWVPDPLTLQTTCVDP